MRNSKKFLPLFLIIALILYLYLNNDKKISYRESDFQKVRVEKVIDGDTLRLSDGQKVRIIGINSPEVGKNEETLGKEAKEFAKSLMEDRQIWLERDISDVDRYNRLLRYVWLKEPKSQDPKFFEDNNYSALVISKGLARTYTFKPDTKYLDIFKKLEKEARDKRYGMWAYDYEITRGDRLEN